MSNQTNQTQDTSHRSATMLAITDFSLHLFWDVDRSSINLHSHKAYVIKQVLEYGLLADWLLIRNYYGLNEITIVAKSLPELDDKSLNFVAALSQTPVDQFRCYIHQSSIPPHWNF